MADAGRRATKNRSRSFNSVHDIIDEEAFVAWQTPPRSSPGDVRTPAARESGGRENSHRHSAGGGAAGSRHSTGSAGSRSSGKGQRKRFQDGRLRFRNMEGGDDGLAHLLHRQASFSEVNATPTVLTQDKLQRRIDALESIHAALKTPTAFPSPERQQRAGPEQQRKGLVFSTFDFWVELRAAVVARRRARPARQRTRAAGARHFFAAPTTAQLEEERERVDLARRALPELITEVKRLRFASGLSLSAALREVTRLLEKIDGACDAAFPTVYSTGRLLAEDCKAYSYYAGSSKRHYGDGGWGGVRSVAVSEPETVSGSVEDKSTFVSRVEALRAWQAAVLLSMPLLARFRREAEDDRWLLPDLGGLLRRTHVSMVMRGLVTDLQPGMVAVHGLYYPLAESLQSRPALCCSSAAWLNLSTLRVRVVWNVSIA